MKYEMRLREEFFEYIDQGIKKVEYRLNDEKRKKLKIGDKIIFIKKPLEEEKIEVIVSDLKYYDTMLEMFTDTFDMYLNKQYKLPEDASRDVTYYTAEEMKKYGCVAIFFKKLK